jgi:drug/metabolite transporter (DMT)-like permease
MALIILLVLIAAFFSSVYNISTKFVVAAGTVRALPAALLVQMLAGVIAFIFLSAGQIAIVPSAMPYVLGVVAFALTGFILMMIANAWEDASVVAPVLGFKVIFLPFLELFFRHRHLSSGVWLGAVVSLVGLVFISQTDRWSLHPRDLLRPGVLLMMVTALLFSFSDIALKLAVDHWSHLGVTGYALMLQGIVSAVLLALLARMRPVLINPLNWPAIRTVRWPLLLSAVMAFGYQYLFFQAFALGNGLTQINILYNTRNLMVVLLMALLVLSGKTTVERVGWRAYTYRTVGALLTLAAVALAIVW